MGLKKSLENFCHESIQTHVRKLLETSLIIDPSKKKINKILLPSSCKVSSLNTKMSSTSRVRARRTRYGRQSLLRPWRLRRFSEVVSFVVGEVTAGTHIFYKRYCTSLSGNYCNVFVGYTALLVNKVFNLVIYFNSCLDK